MTLCLNDAIDVLDCISYGNLFHTEMVYGKKEFMYTLVWHISLTNCMVLESFSNLQERFFSPKVHSGIQKSHFKLTFGTSM